MKMARATWNGTILAESEQVVVVEGNLYFPPRSIQWEFFQPSASKSTCFWKGVASYYDVVIDGSTNKDAAWTYPDPSEAAESIKDHIAFWKGVKVEP
jgi:uncharacterized protein (DUF427 family)